MSISIKYLSTAESCYFVNWYGKSLKAFVSGDKLTIKDHKNKSLVSVPVELSNSVLKYHAIYS